MTGAYLALLGRIVMLGYERIIVKKLGTGSSSESAAFLFFAIAAVFLFPFVFFVESPEDYGFVKVVLINSVIYSAAFILYVKSLSLGEASLVSPLYNFNVFFLLLLAAVFLGEAFTVLKAAGLILLVYGASYLNRQNNPLLSLRALFKDRACVFMMICSMLIAVGRTIDMTVLKNVHPVVYAFALNAGMGLVIFLYVLLAGRTKSILDLLKAKRNLAAASGLLNAFSYLCLLLALKKMPVSVAEPASMLGMVITVILAHFVFREAIRDRLVGVVVMIFGAWLLFL
ncbi:MAG TPA: DMT family transporter [bacterium]|nr:DMT family transporter [bacterium]